MTAAVHPTAIAIRLATVLLSAGAVALIPSPSGGVYGFVVIGTVLAVVAPNRAGALLVLLTDVLGWASAYGTHTVAPTGRTIAFAIMLYLLHASVALAASVPAASYVQPAVIRRWLLNCVPGVGAAVVLGIAVGVVGSVHGSLGLDLAGLAAAVGVVGAIVGLSRLR